VSRAIEHIVRPFVIGDVFSRSRLPPVTENPTVVVPEDVHHIWDGKADTSYRDDGKQWYSGFSSDLKEDKTQRQSKLVKVVNPDDTDQKVFVERIDKATFKDAFGGKSLSLSFDWSSPKDSGS
jgi:hypothetical protein